ncbi:hypothetical protein, variant [Verruconis gallopava]|uniref:YTH domain-containing protein n=1 Tax=Verruconis gallopava TaxID=253628 RepID=A0A0D2A9A2_9PEZI|nr:uncharacterized protein PV09_05553 [Verruconis gallopava]XP_016213213.1 hypothetical protein, variant [Verruconis gallopava]KIW03343.1 hypothetical protein PV09_05553 [Verruconis gallopava]KIW03344.1 hypothetical protein, variant [Verruconis gallopava]
MSGNTPFFSQLSAIPSVQQRMDSNRYPYAAGGNPGQQPSNFNMSAMSVALPDYSSQPQPNQNPQVQPQGQRRLSGASTPAVVYQMQQNLQYPHQSNTTYGNQGGQTGFGQAQFPLYGQLQSPHPGGFSQVQPQRLGGLPQHFNGYSQISPQYYYYPGTTPAYHSIPFQPGATLHVPVAARGGIANVQGATGSDPPEVYQSVPRQITNSNLSPVPRGPPRKPKQSGHALWVGNLPPGAVVTDLKDHFSREATRDIESLFLISKSNCAFVNYRTEAACQAAMKRFHDSRFHGVRLVCRLRRSSTPASGVPTAPAAMAGRRESLTSSGPSPVLENAVADTETTEKPTEHPANEENQNEGKVAEKFFIVKSLTLQDLEQSVRTGVWATQSHNEQILNKAYASADNVYLIFSANKSGEYFGYARMASPINENAAEIIRTLPQPEATEATDAPKTIPTPATEWAPKGRIIDDSARGTIFWEAELSDEEEESNRATTSEEDADSGSEQVWGKPFKIEWISTNRLPFYRTRGLRNPWNANREVKIARDGTELETSVGKKLIQMFHRPGPAPTSQMPVMAVPAQMGGSSMPF